MEEINTTETVETAETAETAETVDTSSNEFLNNLPEEYKAKPYMQNINDMDGLLKKLDNSQQLIGKKKQLNLPNDKSTPEEWDKYYEAIGRPSKAEEYKLEYPEELSEIINEESLNEFKRVAHEQGISEKQAQSLLKYETELYGRLLEKHKEEQANSEKQFQELATKAFGSEKEKILETGESLVNKYLPKGMEEHFTALDNNTKVLMASVLNGIKNDYMSEDSLTNISKGNKVITTEEQLAKARELMKHPSYQNEMSAEHDNIKRQVNEIYRRVYPD